MNDLIKFELSFDKLNKKEKQLFFNKIISLYGYDLIKDALFSHFSQKIISHQSYDENQVKLIKETASNIINDRPPSEDTENCIKYNLDVTVPDLLGHIASFLPVNDYNILQKLNRKCYIGVNNAFKMKRLSLINKNNLYWDSFAGSLSFHKIQNIVELEITLFRFNTFLNPKFTSNQLSRLKILKLYQIKI